MATISVEPHILNTSTGQYDKLNFSAAGGTVHCFEFDLPGQYFVFNVRAPLITKQQLSNIGVAHDKIIKVEMSFESTVVWFYGSLSAIKNPSHALFRGDYNVQMSSAVSIEGFIESNYTTGDLDMMFTVTGQSIKAYHILLWVRD